MTTPTDPTIQLASSANRVLIQLSPENVARHPDMRHPGRGLKP